MLTIDYPAPGFQLRNEAGKEFIFDALRRKWLLLTPEEWVRQNFLQYLIQIKKYPPALIALEKMIMLGELRKRFDILVYDRDHKPWMMIECKAPTVSLDEGVFQQLLRYHISVPTGFLVITNGNKSYGWKKEGNDLLLISELPVWETI